jgi:hypothetical protein
MDIRTPWLKERKWYFFSIVGLFLFVILAEVGLRFVLGLGRPILYEPSAESGYFMRPHQYTRRLFATTSTNSYGMRSPEFAREKPSGTLRLMFLGDSITYGTTQVDQNDIFVEKVRRDLSVKLRRRVEDLNASANGWAISNEYGFLQSRGTYGSDYLLLVLNSGDLTQPFSKLSDVQGARTEYPHTAIGELLDRLLLLRKHYSQHDPGTAVEDDPQTEQANLRDLTSMVKISRAQGTQLLLIFIPICQVIPQGASSSAQYDLKNWAETEGVTLFDLTNSVSAYETSAITLLDRVHYNSHGNWLLANSLEKYLEDKFSKVDSGQYESSPNKAGYTNSIAEYVHR